MESTKLSRAFEPETREAAGRISRRTIRGWKLGTSKAGRAGGFVPPLILGLGALLLWQLLVLSGSVSSFLLPSPAEVAQAFWDGLTNGLLWRYTRTTLTESLTGFALGAAVGLPSGYAVAHSRIIARMLEPYLAASQAMPAIALAPLLVLWLGYGLTAVAALCALIVFFPVHVNVVLGIRMLDQEVLDAARVDGAGRWALLRDFELPLALPAVLTGMRTGLTLSVTGAVVGEFVIGDRGLGGLLTVARGNFNTPLVFATLVTLALLAAGFYRLGLLIERWLSYEER